MDTSVERSCPAVARPPRGRGDGPINALISIDGGDLSVTIDRMDDQIDRAIAATMMFYSQKATTYARQHARWQDRTGNARNGLFARVDRESQGRYNMTVSHSVPYGVWLEVRWAGRYAIIRPTLDYVGPLIMNTLSQIFRQL